MLQNKVKIIYMLRDEIVEHVAEYILLHHKGNKENN
jgi:hypothetical protein